LEEGAMDAVRGFAEAEAKGLRKVLPESDTM
jgi:hypothetical protein